MQPLNETQKSLAAEAAERADRIAALFTKRFPEHASDIQSDAALGAIRAAASFDPSNGCAWENWSALKISSYVQNSVINIHREAKVRLNAEELDDVVSATVSEKGEMESKEDFNAMIGMLPVNQRLLCDMVYRQEITVEEASVRLGMTPKNGYKVHNRAIERLKQRLSA